MKKHFKINIQFFGGEGAGAAGAASSSGTAGAGSGEGEANGDASVASTEQKLRQLGVPEAMVKKSASKVASKMAVQSERKNEESVSASNETASEAASDPAPESPKRMTWEEITNDPEYREHLEATIRDRMGADEQRAGESLAKMTPAIEVLARKYGLDMQNMDYDALAKAINDDTAYYEDKALEMGVPVEEAREFDQAERARAREARSLQEQSIRQHVARLEQQGAALKKTIPGFDLREELKNPVFARMTAPGKGLMSVEDAYYAVHRKELQAAAMQVTAQKTAEKISNAIQSGSRRPNESGASSQAPSVSTFDYAKASREQRANFKRDLRARMARGEKVYPGK